MGLRPSKWKIAALLIAVAGGGIWASRAGLFRRGDAPVEVPFHERFNAALEELRIEDLKIGSGPAARVGQRLQFHYQEWLADGTKVDSSVDRSEPIRAVLGRAQLLPGLDHGIVGMKVGGKRKLTIPAFLAFGEKGVGKLVPPNATIVAEVELLGLEADAPAAEPPPATAPAKPSRKPALR